MHESGWPSLRALIRAKRCRCQSTIGQRWSTSVGFIAEIVGHSEITAGQAVDSAERAYVSRHRVGIRVKDVYEVRKIDDSYFAE